MCIHFYGFFIVIVYTYGKEVSLGKKQQLIKKKISKGFTI